MSGRLRARALGIMKQLDQGTSYREPIERELAKRETRSHPVRGSACTCGTANDPDARFCKACGAKLQGVA
jgi:hypothetical protein